MIKKLFFIAALLSLSSCSNVIYPEYYGVGSRNANGLAEGDWTIYRKADVGALSIAVNDYSVFAKGRYSNGRPHGIWPFWTRNGEEEAVLLYDNGVLNGDSRIINFYRTDRYIYLAHFENCKLKSIDGYKKDQIYLKMVMNDTQESINKCTDFGRYKTLLGNEVAAMSAADAVMATGWSDRPLGIYRYDSILIEASKYSKP